MTVTVQRIAGMPLKVYWEAFDLLTFDMQNFIRTLQHEAAVINGFLWDSITLFSMHRVKCVILCKFGSPSRDICFVWVYNTKSCEYEMYVAPNCVDVLDIVFTLENVAPDPVFTAATFDAMMHHVRHNSVMHMHMEAFVDKGTTSHSP